MNEAILVGNVGKKDVKPLKNGGEVTVFSMATTEKYMDSSGEKQIRTTWHNINCFSKLGEIAAKYVHIGDLVGVRGKISHKKIEQGERTGQYVYSVTAQDVHFLGNAKKKDSESAQPARPATPKPKPQSADNWAADDEMPF